MSRQESAGKSGKPNWLRPEREIETESRVDLVIYARKTYKFHASGNMFYYPDDD